MQRAACPRNGTGLQASARPARGDPVLFVAQPQTFLQKLALKMKNRQRPCRQSYLWHADSGLLSSLAERKLTVRLP